MFGRLPRLDSQRAWRSAYTNQLTQGIIFVLVETELELYSEMVLNLTAKTLLQSPLLANTPLRRL